MPKDQPVDFRAAEAERKTAACYIYIIEHGADLFHLAAYNEDVIVEGLPVAKGTDPQTFTRAQIRHTAPEQRSEIGSNQIDMAIGINDSGWAAQLREVVLYTTPSTVKVTIVRVNKLSLPGPITWGTDTYTIFKGVVTYLSFSASAINLSLVSLIMQSDGRFPRYFRQKSCQHMLGGVACGVDLDDAAFRLETTLDAVALRGRSVDISDLTLDGEAITAETFQAGKLIEVVTGNIITILATEVLPASAGVRLYLGWWSTTIDVGIDVKVVRGCNRTLKMCDEVFDNKDRYGGMPWIPVTSPSVHGV
jgi:hypothetical protein